MRHGGVVVPVEHSGVPQPYGSVASKAQVRIGFADLKTADLIVDAGYDGGKTDRSGDAP
jgi:hypothetical protein